MTIQRGQIYFVDLNPVEGREQGGKRPVLVMSIDEINALPLVVTVVVGTKGADIRRDYSTNVRVPVEDSGLTLETIFPLLSGALFGCKSIFRKTCWHPVY